QSTHLDSSRLTMSLRGWAVSMEGHARTFLTSEALRMPRISTRVRAHRMKWLRYMAVSVCALGIAWFAAGDDLSRRWSGDIDFQTAREADNKDNPTPTWPATTNFAHDTFTFARLRYMAQHERYLPGHTEADRRWLIDFPACDLDLSYRLQQMTSIKVDPDGRVVKMSETNLANF